MTKLQFIRFKQQYKDSKLVTVLTFFNKVITGGTFLSYPVLLCYLLFQRPEKLPLYILVPGISFVLLSLFRNVINRKRPYEAWETAPLIPRDKKGKSFPSRHVFSIFMIATLWYGCFPAIGILLWIAGVLLGIIRVVTGVHYTSDVIAGCLIGILFALPAI